MLTWIKKMTASQREKTTHLPLSPHLTVIYSIHLNKRQMDFQAETTQSDDISPNDDGNEHLDLAKNKTWNQKAKLRAKQKA